MKSIPRSELDSDICEPYRALAFLAQSRRSCRAFRAEPLPRPTIEHILAVAQRTPSWCNVQPWQVAVTSHEGTERLRASYIGRQTSAAQPDLPFPTGYNEPYAPRRRECARQLYESVGIPKGDRAAASRQAEKNFAFFDAPHVAIITTDRRIGVYGAIDCGAYVYAFLLAAQSLGVAAIAQASLARHPDLVRSFFDLPTDRLVVCGISFGWAAEEEPVNTFRTSRVNLSELATFVDK